MKDMKLVKIKTWEQMEREFGLDENGNIPINNIFFHYIMEEEMPQNRIIQIDDKMCWGVWKIVDEMIEDVIKSEKRYRIFKMVHIKGE